MKDEMRMALAVGLIFLLLMVYPLYLKWVSPPQAKEPVKQSETVRTTNNYNNYSNGRDVVTPSKRIQQNFLIWKRQI